MEWYDLHRKLAAAIRDPRQKDGSLITGGEDGVRYPKTYRDDLLNSALRWIIFNFDPVYLLQNGMPGGLLTEESFANSNLITLGGNIMRLLSVELSPSWYVDDANESTIDIQPQNIPVPIITRTTKRLNRVMHSHWVKTPVAYITGRNTIKLLNTYLYPEYGIEITYIQDFQNITENVDIHISQTLQDYVIEKAFVIERRNSQKLQESAYLREQLGGDIQSNKQTIEQTKQTTYLK